MRLWDSLTSSESGRQAPLPVPGEIVHLQSSGDDHIGVYRARVRAVGLRRLFLEDVEPGPPAAEVPARAPLTVSFARGEALYRFETRPVGPIRTGSLTVARPRQVTRVQRRRFYRLNLESPTTFRVLADDDRPIGAPVAARLVNLSGGGALLATAKPVPSGLSVSLRVPSGKDGVPLNVDAEALDCHVASQGASRIYLVRLHFFSPPRFPDEDRELIIAYIFEQQRLMLRTRKLLRA